MSELRLFECACGHKLRFGSSRCGWCFERTNMVNRREFWWVSAIGLSVSVVALVSALR